MLPVQATLLSTPRSSSATSYQQHRQNQNSLDPNFAIVRKDWISGVTASPQTDQVPVKNKKMADLIGLIPVPSGDPCDKSKMTAPSTTPF
jgi:hypothetical protein